MASAVALGNIVDESIIPPLSYALHDEFAAVRLAAAASLGSLGAVASIEPLSWLVSDLNVNVRQTAVVMLGNTCHFNAVKPLARALSDAETSVRLAAVKALAGIRVPESLQALKVRLRPISGELDQEVRSLIKSTADSLELSLAAMSGRPRTAGSEAPAAHGRPRTPKDLLQRYGRPRNGGTGSATD